MVCVTALFLASPHRPGCLSDWMMAHSSLHCHICHLYPSAHPPGPARTHARPPGHWGVLEAHRAPGPGQAVAGLVLAVFGGRAGVSRLECGRGSCGSSTARPPEERAPWTAAYQAPPSMGFSRQEYWSGVPLPSPTLGRFLVFSGSLLAGL